MTTVPHEMMMTSSPSTRRETQLNEIQFCFLQEPVALCDIL